VKRLMVCLSSVALAGAAPAGGAGPTKAAVKAAPAHKTVVARRPACKVAPADEYFGRLKLSILGIRNTIKDQGLRVDYEPGKAPATLGAIALTEDAIRDWEHKYPCDSWLPGTLYALQHFYGKIHTDDGVKHVHATFAWLRKSFPHSSFVRIAVRENGQATSAPPAPEPVPGAAVASPLPSAVPGASAAK